MSTPCVIYAARSQAEEPGKDSTGDQVAIIRERLEREPNRVVYGEPHADHATGYKGNRGPGLEAAMAAAVRAAEGGTAELWVWKSERLARGSGRKDEARSVLEVYVDMRRAGVDIRSVEDDAFLTNPMLVGVADEMAYKYSKDLAANVSRGIDSRVKAGKPWGQPPIPFAAGPDGHWVPVPHEVEVARRVFREHVEMGGSYLGMARGLNNDRVPTRNGGQWSPIVVRRILTGKAVLGFFQFKGEWFRGSHEPVIDEDLWLAAQAISVRNLKHSPGGAGRIPRRHLFIKGALRCSLCGASMLPRTNRHRTTGETIETYVCRTRSTTHGLATCSMPILPRAEVDEAALDLFARWALDVGGTRDRLTARVDARLAEVDAQAQRAGNEAVDLRAQAARLDRDYRSGDLGAASYERLTAVVGDELRAAEAERERLAANAEKVAGAARTVDVDEDALRRIARLYDTVAGRVNEAARQEDVGTLRAALAAVFDGFSAVAVLDADRVTVRTVLADGTPWAIVPELREELIEADGTLRRIALEFGDQETGKKETGSSVSL
jgi:DNA invertase Pin-like site-specific DNA recombinase